MPTRRQLLAAGAGAGLTLAVPGICRATAGTTATRKLLDFRRSQESWTDTWLRALQEMEAGAELLLPAETMVLEAPLVITADGIRIRGVAGAELRAAPSTSFEYLLSAVGRRGIAISGLALDVNQTERRQVQRHRFMGLGLVTCAECTLSQIAVRGTLGFGGIPAVAIAVSGQGRAVHVDQITVEACGTLSQTSDGLYMSGEDHLATNVVARNVTDTAVVLEACNRSRIHNVDVRDSSAAAAVTNITVDLKRDNAITGLVGRNLRAAVTGWINIGCPVERAADLLNTTIEADLASEAGPGPGINVRHVGKGRARGVSIEAKISGTGTQGILVDGNDVDIVAQISQTGAAGIQFQAGASGRVSKSSVTGGTFGLVAQRDADVVSSDTTYRDQSLWNMYAYRGGRIRSSGDTFGNARRGHHGQEPDATVTVS